MRHHLRTLLILLTRLVAFGLGIIAANLASAGLRGPAPSYIIPMPDGDLGNWVFVAGTYDGANWNIYRNGALAASVPSTHGALNITNRWSIGSRSNPNPAANPAGRPAPHLEAS